MKKICSLGIIFLLLINMFTATAYATDVTVVDFNNTTVAPTWTKPRGSGLVADSSHTYGNSTYSAKWDDTVSCTWVESTGQIPVTDWSSYSYVNVRLYSENANNAVINYVVNGLDTSSAAFYYRKPFTLDFSGWKTISLPLSSFSATSSSPSWKSITHMKFAASGWGTTPLWSTEIYLDKIWLSKEAVTDDINCSSVSFTKNAYDGVSVNLDLTANAQNKNAVMVAELYDTSGTLKASSSVAVSNPTDTTKLFTRLKDTTSKDLRITMFEDLEKTKILSKTKNIDLSLLDSPIRVMSYNLRVATNSTRQGYVLQTINKYSPDLMGVQEASVDWMSYLDKNLTDYGHVGIGRDPDNTGEASAIFYKKDKFTLLDSGTFWLSETPEECSYGWGASYRRVCTWAVLRDKNTKKLIAHFNTHLDHVSASAQVNGANLVLSRIKATDLPTVLTGDFNIEEGTTVYKNVTATQFDDSKFVASTTESGGTFHNLGTVDTSTTKPIDFCFVSKGDFNVDTYDVVRDTFSGDYSSDHFPLYADVRLTK